MALTRGERLGQARNALTGLSVGDAFGNQAFRPRIPVVVPGAPPGMWAWTDDSQMACSVLTVLARHGNIDQAALACAFAEHAEGFRDYGMGALRFLEGVRAGGDWALISMDLFAGVGSWGNGGAMRVTPLGAWFSDDLDRAAVEAEASARVTHAHPEGIGGAIAAGVAAAWAASLRDGRPAQPVAELLDVALSYVPIEAGEVRRGLARARTLSGAPAAEVARELGNGSKISAPDTVPFALWVAATHFDDYERAIRTCVAVGGDMDTTAAIVGGILTAHHGPDCIPAAWLEAREPLPTWLPS